MHSISLTHFVYLVYIALRLLSIGKTSNQSVIHNCNLALFIELEISD